MCKVKVTCGSWKANSPEKKKVLGSIINQLKLVMSQFGILNRNVTSLSELRKKNKKTHRQKINKSHLATRWIKTKKYA